MKAIEDRLTRDEIVEAIIARDGTRCAHPEANHELDFDATEGPSEVTIDHWIPQWYGRENDWTMDEIWDLDNLKLMCKKHNAKKGDLLPNPDGTLPEKATKTFRYRRQKRAGRPELCVECDNGHNLFVDEICANCGCNTQRFPRWAKVRAPECSHDITWCWACSIGIIERKGALEMILLGGEGGD